MISVNTIVTALLLSAASGVHAANNWNVPCHQGACEFDVAGSATSVQANMRIWGSTAAISDITEAGGWLIMGCNTADSVQDIRVVCVDDNTDAAGCTHVTENGAVGTVVRLPQTCGKAPFAVVKTWADAKDQSIPADIQAKINKAKTGEAPTVKALTIDSTFADNTATPHGNVNIAVIGASVSEPLPSTQANRRRGGRRHTERSLFGDVGDFFGNVGDKITGAATKAAGAVEGAATKAASAVAGTATKAAGAVSDTASNAAGAIKGAANDANNVSVNKQTTLPPIDVQKSFPIVEADVQCGALGDIKLSVDADVKAHADVTIGVVAGGTLVPPKFDTFSLTSGLSGSLEGALKFKAGASGAPLDTGNIQLFTVGIPGLDIPDILEVGPAFNINGRVNLNLDAEIDLNLGINYDFSNVAFAFPPTDKAPPKGDATPADQKLQLSVSPQIKAEGTAEAHLIPEIAFGINALAGKAKATISFDIDASATADVKAGAGAAIKQDVKVRRSRTMGQRRSVDVVFDRRADVQTGANGCVDIKAGVAGAVKADANLFGLFDVNKSFPVFSKNFNVFSKCFGGAIPTRRTLPVETAPFASLAARADPIKLTCPIGAAAPAAELANETVAATAIKAV